jgi:hippurate hydrolase
VNRRLIFILAVQTQATPNNQQELKPMKVRIARFVLCALALTSAASLSAQQKTGATAEVQAAYAQSAALYLDLHQHPELSSQETQTAAKMATQLRDLGYEVTTGVGGTGVVGILKNGAGPTVMLRTELDALPVTENTGLSFASTVRAKNESGQDVGVAHACGHDLHMSAWIGTARIMAASRNTWKGTLMLIAQPAEETGAGAKAMIADGLLTRFKKPDYALAIHDDARSISGMIGYHAGPILTNADAVTIHIYGRGGHGARPEATVDPIVIAARTVLALQTIVSREMSPFDPTVITVGSIHGGTKNNVIPDEVVLQLTVRSFTTPVREHLLSAITRIANAEAAAAGAPKPPLIERVVTAQALVNDPALTQRVSSALLRELGPSVVKEGPPEMVSEDFSEYSLAGVPTLMLRIGAVTPAKYAAAENGGPPLPSLHSSQFAPDLEPTLKAAMVAEVSALRELMPARGK